MTAMGMLDQLKHSVVQQWRTRPGAVIIGSLVIIGLFFVWPSSSGTPRGSSSPVDFSNHTDSALVKLISDRVSELIYARCSGAQLRRKATSSVVHSGALGPLLAAGNSTLDGKLQFEEATNLKAPCGAAHDCCERAVFFRPNTTDFQVYEQIFIGHYLRYLYALFDRYKPKYVLDAGANAGFSAMLFKLLWPNCTIVALEPDPSNFAALSRNMEGQTDVHVLNAGLWRKTAKIGQQANHGEWGKVFQEVGRRSKNAMQAYGVKDLARKFNIPSFDFVKIDIEGSEGVVFDPEADLSWIPAAKVVSLEIHDFFAGYFGLKDVSSRVAAAFKHLPFKIVTDNEHVMFVSKEIDALLRPL